MHSRLPRFAPSMGGFFIASVVLVGCSVNTKVYPQFSASAESARVTQSNTFAVEPGGLLDGEALTGNDVHVVPANGCKQENVHVTFTASGDATGSYPGTFTATGGWSAVLYPSFGYWIAGIGEAFTIKSGSTRIKGKIKQSYFRLKQIPMMTCASLPAIGARYTLNAHPRKDYGNVSISGISEGVLGETFR
jgi:hypothetical protein